MVGFQMIVDGFLFTDEKTAQKACQESDGIQYVKDRLDMENPRMVLEMYRKLIAERVFETPVGMAYLKELQDYLLTIPELVEENLEPIETTGMVRNAVKEAEKQTQHKEKPKQSSDSGQNQGEGTEKIEEETLDWYVQKLEELKQQERVSGYRRRRAEEKTAQSQKHLRFSLLGNLFLLLVAVGMAVIILTDQHPNVINYENKLIEKYEGWQSELEEREQTVKEQEKKLGIVP